MSDKDKPSAMILPQYKSPAMSTRLCIYHVLVTILSITVARAMLNCTDKEHAMAVYGAYHRTPWNQVIHFFGIPALLFTIFIFLAFVPVTNSIVLTIPFAPSHYPTWATLWCGVYVLFYLYIDVWGALFMTPVLYAMYVTAVRWIEADQRAQLQETGKMKVTGTGRLLKASFLLHVFAWYIQIHLGHALAEGGKPALLDGLGEALSTAPLFAMYEGVWALGVRKAFQERVRELVDQHIMKLCSAGSSMRVCSTLQ
jgi:2-hydroxy fatty acid dioxygenase